MRRAKLGLEKYAAVGYGLQRGRAFVREAEAYEELTYKQTESGFRTGVVPCGTSLWGDLNGQERSIETHGGHQTV